MERPEEWHRFVDALMATGYGDVANAGQTLWAALAAIMVVWYGTQMALAGRGVDLAGLVEFVFGLVLPWAMLQFYAASVPGLGLTTTQVLTGMGGWVQGFLIDDAGTAFRDSITEFLGKLWASLTTAQDRTWWEALTNPLEGAIRVVSALPVVVILGLAMLASYGLGAAQVVWAYFALSLALLLGPIFIPWLMVPQLSWLFWGWFKTVLQYSFYGAVAAGVFRITAQVGVATLDNIGDAPILTTPTGLGNLMDLLGTSLMFAIASFLASLKVGEFVQVLMSGAGSLSSGLGTRLMQASRLAG
jgi:hypothetical protein